MEVFQILDILFLVAGLSSIRWTQKNVSNKIQLHVYSNQVKEKLNSKLAVLNIRF